VPRGALASGRDHYERFGRQEGRPANGDEGTRSLPEGLLGADPLATITGMLASAGLRRLEVLLLVTLAVFSGVRLRPNDRSLLITFVLLAGSLVGFFLGFFGDGMEYDRHVW
jgi:hypothetical protein